MKPGIQSKNIHSYIQTCTITLIIFLHYTTLSNEKQKGKTSTRSSKTNALLYRLILKQLLKAKWLKRHTVTNEMLAHSLDPVQTQRMQHGTSTLHDTQYSNRECEPEVEDKDHDEGAADAGEGECVLHGHFPEDDGETLVGE